MKKWVDHSGRVFGQLLAIEKSIVQNKYGYYYYITKCLRCDKFILCTSHQLTEAAKRKRGGACGCGIKDNVGVKENILGNKYNKLTVIEETNIKTTHSGSYYWICKCDCGGLTLVDIGSLKSGNTKSCNKCFKGIDERGNKYNSLEVLDYTDINTDNGVMVYLCKCICGKTINVKSSNLRNNIIQSCGCIDVDTTIIKDKYFRDFELEYEGWRNTVFARDNYKCQLCNNSGEVNAHHIAGYNEYEHMRYEIVNGITLCKDCHIGFIQNMGTKIFNRYIF